MKCRMMVYNYVCYYDTNPLAIGHCRKTLRGRYTVENIGARSFIMRLFLILFSLTFVRGQVSLQEDYNTVFSSAEDLRRKDQDGLSKFSDNQQSSLPQSRLRLSNTVIPIHYRLTITPIIYDGQTLGGRWTTPGSVEILVECKQSTQVIQMHSKNIAINETLTKVLDGETELGISDHHYNETDGFLHLNLTSSLQVGRNYTIRLTFVSLISEELNGLYQSSYVDPSTGATVWLATTQLEALHARQMFPCFDEPSLKAVFDVTIGRKNEDLALFNTESVRNASMDGVEGWVWETFAPTVKMSTYLLAVIISNFEYSEAPGNVLEGKIVRTYAPKHYIDAGWGTYAAEVAEQLLLVFGEYYDQVYPLSKMDSAAVPDFYFGAMENWGLNIYRESALLYLSGESTEAERFSITRVLAHELGHQWFGNLVTAGFWTHIWLNEGFATYVAALAVNVTHPQFEPWERFQNDAVQAAMAFDARQEVTHSVIIDEEIWPTKWAMDWFDRLSYEKGASLIRMMNGFLTEETLKKGLRRYLDAKKYQGAFQDELFSNLQEDAQNDGRLPPGLTMKDIMDTWTLQPHFPLIRVSRASANRIFISQEIFSNNGLQYDSSKDLNPDHLWNVPVSIASAINPNFDPMPDLWIQKNIALTPYAIDTSQWIIANAGATGYYRVLYDTALTNLIRNQLNANHAVISSSVTRSQLLDDYFSSAFQRYISIETALQLTDYLGNETEVVVWNSVLSHLRQALNLINNNNLRTYLLPKITSALNLVGGADATVTSGMPTIRHLQFLDWNCALEGPECASFARSLYDQWKTTPATTPVRTDIRPVVYCAIVANGEAEAFNFIKARYNDVSTNAKQKGTLLNALGCARDNAVIQGILENLLNDTYDIPKNVRGTLLQRLSMNKYARDSVIRFFRASTPQINTYFGNINAIANAVSTMSSYLATGVDADSIEALKTEHIGLIGTRLDVPLRTIQNNIQWMADFGNSMSAYFASNS